MKLEELKPDTEYAAIAGKWRRTKVKFTAEDLASKNSYRRNKGAITGQAWEMSYGDRIWQWRKSEISLNQIKMLWAEYEIEAEAEAKEQAQRAEQRRIEEKKRAEETKALQDFLATNKEQIAEILGLSAIYSYGPRLEVKLSLETLTRLLERVN